MVGCRCEDPCIRPAEDVLAGIDGLYMACLACPPEPGLDKGAPFRSLEGTGRGGCEACGRRPLDLVMLDILDILVKEGLRGPGSTLREVGTPLIEVGYPLAYPPRLGAGSLIVVSEKVSKKAARKVLSGVPEVKGVIEGRGVPGVLDLRSGGRSWKLLAGCDLRGDVVQSVFGDLVVYKSQSEVHIEFSRQGAPKVRILEDILLGGRVGEVVDGMAGPGTLGLVCALAGASRVVLNDVWLPAVENAMNNLWANRNVLGIEEIERVEEPGAKVGDEPVLVGRAHGSCDIEVYHGSLQKLFTRARPAQLCLVDPFPGADIVEIKEACSCCHQTVVI